MNGIPFPDIDPIAFSIGPVDVAWYGIAYLAGLMIGWRYTMAMAPKSPGGLKPADYDDFLVWAVVGVILGGRLGQVIFYHPGYYFSNPVEIFKVWEGGMAFHGGLLGVIVAMLIFTRKRGLPLLAHTDIIALVAPIGICFGRIANFINQEHWGRVSDAPWAIIFDTSPLGFPRHPSQLYEAFLEGALLYAVLAVVVHGFGGLKRPGLVTGLFLAGYSIARIIAEFFREPEVLTEILPFATTWGQWLSVPMLLLGIFFITRAKAAKTA